MVTVPAPFVFAPPPEFAEANIAKASAILVEAFSCSLPGLNPALIHGTTLWALAAIEGHDSFDIDDSAEEFEDPTRWTSNGGKGKDKVSEAPPNEPYSSGEGGSTAGGSGIRDGADGHVNNVASASALPFAPIRCPPCWALKFFCRVIHVERIVAFDHRRAHKIVSWTTAGFIPGACL